jgi:hypothetical protein
VGRDGQVVVRNALAVLNETGTADPYAWWQGSVGNRRPYALTGLSER